MQSGNCMWSEVCEGIDGLTHSLYHPKGGTIRTICREYYPSSHTVE